MTGRLDFRQVDVFTDEPYRGNPLAVVHGADALSGEQMQRVAHWTNLSETAFLLMPSRPDADYRVRIFTPSAELPFAGHPTIGACHAWLEAGGNPMGAAVAQECGAGLVPVRRAGGRLAFAAPPLLRSGPVEEPVVERVAASLGVERDDIVDAEWIDNGPGWVGVLLRDAAAVLALHPGIVDLDIGVVGLHAADAPSAIEVRAFFPKDGATAEDPVTGSLNASIAGWLLRTGRVQAPYVATQGAALGRDGRVHVSTDADGTVWVGGDAVTCIVGEIALGPAAMGSAVRPEPRGRPASAQPVPVDARRMA
jgi:PhzF family phenazine biosynthesis protein